MSHYSGISLQPVNLGGKLSAVKLLDSFKDLSRNEPCQHQSMAGKLINLILIRS